MAVGGESTFEDLPIRFEHQAAISVRSPEGLFLFIRFPNRGVDLISRNFHSEGQFDFEFSAAEALNTRLDETSLSGAIPFKPSNRLATILDYSEGQDGKEWVDITRVIYPADVTESQVRAIERVELMGARLQWFTVNELSMVKDVLRFPELETIAKFHMVRAYGMGLGFEPEQLLPLTMERAEGHKAIKYSCLKEMERIASFT